MLAERGPGPILELFSPPVQLRRRQAGDRVVKAITTRASFRARRRDSPKSGFLVVRKRRRLRPKSFSREVCVLLALDVQVNTNVTVGAFEDPESWSKSWRLRTVHEQTADEWGVLLRNLFHLAGLDTAAVSGIIVASVVPPIDAALALMARRYFKMEATFVTHKTSLEHEDLL